MNKICSKCKENKPLEDYYTNNNCKDGKASECKSCHDKYQKSDKGILARAKYFKSDKGKSAQTKYQKSDKGKSAQTKYQKSDKGILAQAKYFKSDKGKSTKTKYQKTDKGKIIKAKANAKYEKSDKGILARAEYQKSDKGKLTQAKYMKSDKGRLTQARSNHKSRDWKSKTISNLALYEKNIILFLQNYQCIGSDHEGGKYFDKVEPTIDHIKPLSKGGDLIKENVQYLCQSCNSKKHTKYIDYRSKIHKEVITRIEEL
jgi:hypothetical protein